MLLAILAGGLFAPPAQRRRQAAPLRQGAVRDDQAPARSGKPGRAQDQRVLPLLSRGAATSRPIVAVEGGPGYPSTGSKAEYRGIFGPLLRNRDLLMVDNRGTGRSALIDCDERAVLRAGVRAGRRSRGARRAVRGRSTRATAAAPPGCSRPPTRPTTSPRCCARWSRAGRPLRRLVRELVRAGLRGPPPARRPLADPRLGLSASRDRSLVPVVGGDDAQRAGDRLARLRRAARPAARRGCARSRSAATRSTPTGRR